MLERVARQARMCSTVSTFPTEGSVQGGPCILGHKGDAEWSKTTTLLPKQAYYIRCLEISLIMYFA